MKCEYTQVYEIDTDKLRQFCINNNFYTQGDCEAYSKMFGMARKYAGGIEVLIDIAEDIYAHSSGDSLRTFTYSGLHRKDVICDLMTEIYRNCVDTWFE